MRPMEGHTRTFKSKLGQFGTYIFNLDILKIKSLKYGTWEKIPSKTFMATDFFLMANFTMLTLSFKPYTINSFNPLTR